MKKSFSAKNIFLKIFLPICAATFFSACDLFQETPKNFLEDYASVASVESYTLSASAVSQGAWQNIDSNADFTINYFVDNPGNHRLRAVIESPNSFLSDFVFPENNGLLQSWIEETTDEDGNVTRTSHTETDKNFLKSTFSIKIPQASLTGIDGDISQFDISPTVVLYRADFGEEERIQSSHTIHLRCNTPPAAIEGAVGQMIETGDVQKLVLAIKLPAFKSDDKYLTISENGRTHVFNAHFSNGDPSTDGWTISSVAPSGMEKTGAGKEPPAGANCFITTDINIKNRAPFGITLTLTDEGGLSSSLTFTSHGQQLSPPEPASVNTKLDQSESDGMATYILNAESGATIHYTVKKQGDTENYSEGSGASPLAIKLPAGTFDISAHATKPGFVDSEEFKKTVTVNSIVFFVSANGSDTSGDGSKSKPFASIAKAAVSFDPPPSNPEDAKIFLLTDLEITGNGKTYGFAFLQGCKGGNKGSRVTISFNLTTPNTSAFAVTGSVKMQDLNITQSNSSTSIASGILVETGTTLALKNVSISGMKTTNGAVEVNGILNILGGVKITGNTSAADSGKPLNLKLLTGKTITVQSGSLEGTQIGVSTQEKPTGNNSVIITSGYNVAGYEKSHLNSFTSDEGFELKVKSGEAALSASGGTITIVPPEEIKFSLDANSGDGSAITISATGDGTSLVIADFTTFVADIYLGSVPTGKKVNFKSSNPFKFEPSWNLDSGDYVIKITAIYGGKEFSDELTYNYTKP